MRELVLDAQTRRGCGAGSGSSPAGGGSNASGTRGGVHSDVCEVSLNIALRTTRDLLGSRVGFEPSGGGAESAGEVLWLDHAAGTAFLNLCQQRHGVEPLVRGGRDTLVIRGFASKFRRAPAEGWYEQCAAVAGAEPKDET